MKNKITLREVNKQIKDLEKHLKITALHGDSKQLEEGVKKLQELEEIKLRLTRCKDFVDAIGYYDELFSTEEAKNLRKSNIKAYSKEEIVEMFLKIPKSYRGYALSIAKKRWGFLKEVAKLLKFLSKLKTADSLDEPTPQEALKILKKLKEKFNWTWAELKELLKEN